MANSFQKLADILNIETARLSGDPRRLQLASQMQEQKELKQATAQSEAEINKAIDESNLPESQKRLLKAMDLASKTKVLYEAQTKKTLTDTAKQREYAQLTSILEDPEKTPEEKDLAKKFFAGITGGKSKEQTIRELVASLAKTVNPYTQKLYTPTEIEEQIKQIEPLLGGLSLQDQSSSKNDQLEPFEYGDGKYKVTPLPGV
jgi:hypothetical protein